MTSQDQKDNKLATNIQNGQVVLNENFDPIKAQDLQPGSQITKQVTVTNTGNSYMFVRVSFQELLSTVTGAPANADIEATAAPDTTLTTANLYSTNGDPSLTNVVAPATTPAGVSGTATTLFSTTAGTTGATGNPFIGNPAPALANTVGALVATVDTTAYTANQTSAPVWVMGSVGTGTTATATATSGWVELSPSQIDDTGVLQSTDPALAATPGLGNAGLHILYKETITNLDPTSTATALVYTSNSAASYAYYAYYDTGVKDANGVEICQQVKLGDSGSSYTTPVMPYSPNPNDMTTAENLIPAKVAFFGVGGQAATTTAPAPAITGADGSGSPYTYTDDQGVVHTVNYNATTLDPIGANGSTAGNIEYMWYNGIQSSNSTWAGENPLNLSTTTPTSAGVAATAAQSGDLTNGTGTNTYSNSPASPVGQSALAQTPTLVFTADPTDSSLVDVTSPLDPMLILKFKATDLENTPADPAIAPTAGNMWWYNVADGYFYWMAPLAPGNSTTELLDSFMLSTAATGAYANMKYDLAVYMDSIQATAAALSSTGTNVYTNWNVGPSALLTALTNQPNVG
jgi:hypothetical protein